MSDPREEKLPKWAQDELRLLRDRVAELEADLNGALQLAPSKGALGKIIVDGGIKTAGFPLSDWARIDFFFGPDRHNKITIMFREEGKFLDINSSRGLTVYPVASNCIYVRPEDR